MKRQLHSLLQSSSGWHLSFYQIILTDPEKRQLHKIPYPRFPSKNGLRLVPGHINLQLLDSVPQTSDLDAQQFGRTYLNALGLLEGILDDCLFDPLEPFIKAGGVIVILFLHHGQTAAQLGRQMRGLDIPFSREQARPFQSMQQFAHIPGPGVGHEHLPGLIRDRYLPAHAGGKPVEEQWDIFQTVPQRGQLDGEHIDPEIEILPKPLFPHLFSQALVGRGNRKS
jgi:hypothetical protein